MQLRPDQLTRHLQGTLAPIYVVSGDEPLQMMETTDAIRQAARKQGFDERQVFHVDGDFSWSQLADESNSLSLFSSQRILELRMPKAAPGKEGIAVLTDYAERPPDDTVLIVVCPRLDARVIRSRWVSSLDKQGVLLRLWPIERSDLPRWVNQRMRDKNLSPDPQAVQCLVDRVEGNLLAAAQEIDKLALLLGDGATNTVVDADRVIEAVTDSARYDVFGLVDTMLQGDVARSVHMIEGLRAEGVAEPVVLWALSAELRKLAQLQQGIQNGQSSDSMLKKLRVFPKRQTLVTQALRKLSLRHLQELLRLAAKVDQAVKGVSGESAWGLLTRLTVRTAMVCRR